MENLTLVLFATSWPFNMLYRPLLFALSRFSDFEKLLKPERQ